MSHFLMWSYGPFMINRSQMISVDRRKLEFFFLIFNRYRWRVPYWGIPFNYFWLTFPNYILILFEVQKFSFLQPVLQSLLASLTITGDVNRNLFAGGGWGGIKWGLIGFFLISEAWLAKLQWEKLPFFVFKIIVVTLK